MSEEGRNSSVPANILIVPIYSDWTLDERRRKNEKYIKNVENNNGLMSFIFKELKNVSFIFNFLLGFVGVGEKCGGWSPQHGWYFVLPGSNFQQLSIDSKDKLKKAANKMPPKF